MLADSSFLKNIFYFSKYEKDMINDETIEFMRVFRVVTRCWGSFLGRVRAVRTASRRFHEDGVVARRRDPPRVVHQDAVDAGNRTSTSRSTTRSSRRTPPRPRRAFVLGPRPCVATRPRPKS